MLVVLHGMTRIEALRAAHLKAAPTDPRLKCPATSALVAAKPVEKVASDA
jgi:hypothetical protein